MKRGPTSQQPQQAQSPPGLPSRGFGNIHTSSAFAQHEPQRRHSVSGRGFKRDPYDTDAESIDITVNQSVLQVEDSQTRDAQYQEDDEGINEGEESDQEEDRSEGDDEDNQGDDNSDYHFTQEDVNFLHLENLQHLSRAQAIEFLQQARPRGLPTIEGDSYPPTTNGDPTEWEVAQEPPSQDSDDGGFVSPSPRRPIPNANGERLYAPPPKDHGYRGSGGPVTGQSMDSMFKQSASIRGQQRMNSHQNQKPAHGHQGNIAPMHLRQPPSYSQASRKIVQTEPVKPQPHSNPHVAFDPPQQHVERTRSGPAYIALKPPKPLEAPVPAKRPSSAHEQVVPIIQHASVRPQQIDPVNMHPHGDYDLPTLHAMKYEQLKNESFDTNPQAKPLSLSEEMLQQSLVDRLDHVQKHCGPETQAHFFQSLPTTEWEEAGDWFLDRFSSIIQRTREARQKKRKLAQEFEDQVEKRHKHVSKKLHQVEDAMSKMKAQGEGLVPKSPRMSKSPRPKKG